MRGTKKIIFALACFLVAGAYWGSSPSHAHESEAVTAPPAQAGSSGFNHRRKEHQKYDCSHCHQVSSSPPFDVKAPAPSQYVFPGHAKCAECHNFALMYFLKPQFCTACHARGPISRGNRRLYDNIKQAEASDFGIAFSHKTHVTETVPGNPPSVIQAPFSRWEFPGNQPAQCTDCHKMDRAVSERKDDLTTDDMSLETGHRNCFVCHGEAPATRPKPASEFPYRNDCKECHDIAQSDDFKHQFDAVREFRHVDHYDYDIRPRKKSEFPLPKLPERLCNECHSSVREATTLAAMRLPDNRYCAECHNGILGLPDRLRNDVERALSRR